MPRCAAGRCSACSIRCSASARARLPRTNGRLPLTLAGARDPIPIVFEPPVPSAQLKSATLLAGLAAPGETVVIEAEATRDHTEKMLAHFGAEIRVEAEGGGRRITLTGQPELVPAAGHGSGRSVFGGIPAGRRLAGARLRRDPPRRHDESAAHRTSHHARRNGRRDRDGSRSATKAARTSPICAFAPAACAASRCRRRARRR